MLLSGRRLFRAIPVAIAMLVGAVVVADPAHAAPSTITVDETNCGYVLVTSTDGPLTIDRDGHGSMTFGDTAVVGAYPGAVLSIANDSENNTFTVDPIDGCLTRGLDVYFIQGCGDVLWNFENLTDETVPLKLNTDDLGAGAAGSGGGEIQVPDGTTSVLYGPGSDGLNAVWDTTLGIPPQECGAQTMAATITDGCGTATVTVTTTSLADQGYEIWTNIDSPSGGTRVGEVDLINADNDPIVTSVPVAAGDVITVPLIGYDGNLLTHTHVEVCDTPTAAPSSTSGGSLAVTGTNAGIIAGVGAIVVLLGVGTVVAARRRRA